jgi:hypothetical protein
MRYILLFWALPMSLFWGWFGLSFYDLNFGLLIFSRMFHDFALQLYGNILGIDPVTIPPLLVRACLVDTALIFGIFAFRRRHEIAAWWREKQGAMDALPIPAADRAPPAE